MSNKLFLDFFCWIIFFFIESPLYFSLKEILFEESRRGVEEWRSGGEDDRAEVEC